MKIAKCRKIGLIVALGCSLLLARENRGYGFLMLEEPVSPRNTAMGSAGTALGGSGFFYYNPAQIFFNSATAVTPEFGQMPGGVNRGGVEASLLFPTWFAGLGLYSSALDFETRDERGFGVKEYSSTNIGSFAAGIIRDRLAVAVSLNGVQDPIAQSNYYGISLSGGLGYKLIPGKLDLGAAGFHGIGKSKGYLENGNEWQNGRIPRFARFGAAWNDTLKQIPYTLAADVVYRDEDASVTVPVGLELAVLPMMDVRIGKRFGMETEILSLGVGLNIKNISFDAAFVPVVFVNDYDMKWSMGFTYALSNPQKENADNSSKPVKTEEKANPQVAPVEVFSVEEAPVEEKTVEPVIDSASVQQQEPSSEEVEAAKEETVDQAEEETVQPQESAVEQGEEQAVPLDEEISEDEELELGADPVPAEQDSLQEQQE